MPPRRPKAPATGPSGPQQTNDQGIAASESIEANPGPVDAFPSPPVVAAENVIDMDHPMRHDDTLEYHLPADQPEELDAPGPSSTYFPQQPSPSLPNLSSRPFPPNDEDDDDQEDDEVVAKLPIYLYPGLFPHLHLFQFPLSHKSLAPSTWAKDRGKNISTRVKEKVGRVEVEIPVDGGDSVWRDEKARDLGFVMDVNAVNGHADDPVGGYGTKKDKKESKKKKKEKWGDKTRYRSEMVPTEMGYYSGVVQDGALHLHPISKVMQFRTNLQYLDDVDTANRERASRRGEDDDDEKAGAKATDARAKAAVLSQQSRGRRMHEEQDNDGSGSIKDFRTKMWNTAADEEVDPWIPYAWKVDEDDRVAQSLGRLYVPEGKREKLDCLTKGLDYLNRPDGI